MRVMVTGAAGFIGAALTRSLLARGDEVIGVDCFLDSYPRAIKVDRLTDLFRYPTFRFVEANLSSADLDKLLEGADCVFHLAAQAGVRKSWGKQFEVYTQSNILVTQKLLETAKCLPSLRRFVYASSSSVYGNAETLPTPEDSPLNPLSPYAVSKLAGEHLCRLYHENYGTPVVVLRYFTVYGPKPRPDQAVCIFTRALLGEEQISLFGNGEQLRGMTYLEDVVRANLLASEKDCIGNTINIGGGISITVGQLIKTLEDITGKEARVTYLEPAKGDAQNTFADITRAKKVLGWVPQTDIVEGLEKTVISVREYYGNARA